MAEGQRPGRAKLAALALCALATGGAGVCASSEAAAQATPAQSNDPRVCLDRAMTDFRAGNFRPALQNFQRTFDLTGNPAILFNIAVTWQRLGEPGEAARALRRFLVAQPQAQNRADVEQQIRSLEEEDAHLHPASRAPEGNTGTPSSSPPPPAPPQHETPPTRSIIGPVAVTAAGGAALVAGIVFIALREVALGDLSSHCTVTGDVWQCDNTSALMDRYRDAGTFTAVGLTTGIVGVLAVAGGLTWLLLPSRDGRRDTGRAVGFGATANGASITFGGTF